LVAVRVSTRHRVHHPRLQFQQRRIADDDRRPAAGQQQIRDRGQVDPVGLHPAAAVDSPLRGHVRGLSSTTCQCCGHPPAAITGWW
jgi:hypothetical protein